eukprot:72645-Chlamydomonas_euryale.AAC.1
MAQTGAQTAASTAADGGRSSHTSARASGAGEAAPSAPSICEVTTCATGQSQRVCSRAVAGAAAG